MWRFLEEIRARPEPERKRFAFLTASVITIVIGVGWLMTFLYPKDISAVQNSVETPSIGNTFSSIEILFSDFFQEFSDAQENIGSLDDVLNNSEQGATTTGGGGTFATSTLGTTTPESVHVEAREEPENVLE